MIEIIEGFGVGSGKSYYVVTRLLKHWRRGGTAFIVDTMSINWPECKKYVELRYGLLLEDSQLNYVTEEQVVNLHEHTPPGTEDCPLVIVVDECQGTLNARDWADKSKRGLFDWCTQSRHDCNDLWFISQSALNIDKQLRRLATYVWRVRNTETWGKNIITLICKIIKFITCGLCGRYFLVSQLDQDNRTLIGKKQWIDQEKDVFRCYFSRAMAGKRKRAGAAVCRLKLSRKVSKRPWLRYAVGGVSIALCFAGCKLVKHMTGRDKVEPEKKVEQAATKHAPDYETRLEAFRGQAGPRRIKTDHFSYATGEMSPDGFVEVIGDGVVRIRKPDGGMLFIVTDKYGGKSIPVPATMKEPLRAEPHHEIIGAADHGPFREVKP